MRELADVEVQEIDDPSSLEHVTPSHWVIFECGLAAYFMDEDAACAFQRRWREAIGLDPMTGEPVKSKPQPESRIPSLLDATNTDMVLQWFTELAKRDLMFHPEDDPASIIDKSYRPIFTETEVAELRMVLSAIHDAGITDPCSIALRALDNLYNSRGN